MKALHMIAFILLVIGGLNWGLYGIVGWDIGSLIGGMDSIAARIIYILVGLSALWIAIMHRKECKMCTASSMAPSMGMGGQM